MGCGASTLGDNGAVTPVKARPLFLHRFEEFKKRRHSQAFKGTTPSKKELLLADKEEDQSGSTKQDLCNKTGKDSFLHDETGSCVTSEGSKGGSPDRLTKEDSEKEDAGKKDVCSEEDISREKGNLEENEGRSIEPLAKDEAKVERVMDGDVKKVEEVEDHEDDDHDDDDDVDDDGRMIRNHEDDLFFPGSPSFRVYFVDKTKDNKDEGVDDHLTDVAPTDDDSVPSKQLPVAEESKKGKKRRSFKKVLPTGKQAKNMFNVRACMSSNSHHDRTHLLPAKAQA
ncbi:uncharacterized protein [Coffea arabica]|uniref:Uncharacterized protein n=1 Tax=Coffea arabica TaxID=13443 RepID=A0A6P6X9P0_COFAR|nr:nucleolin-like [Coffea arabica]